MAEFTKVADTKELPPGTSKCVELDGQKVALFNVDGSIHAISDACTHVGGPLSEGDLDGAIITCPLHGATFDVTTGKVTGAPAAADADCFQVRVEGDDIQIAPS